MSYRSVNPAARNFIKTRAWKTWTEGEEVEGYKFESSETDKFGKPIYGLKVISSNFGAKEGEDLYLNTGGNFQNLMDMVEEGEKIKVVYKGMAKVKKGKWAGTMTHNIDVLMEGQESEETESDVL